MMEILQQLGLSVGYFTHKFCLGKDCARIKNLKRKRKRAIRKGSEDKDAEKEGDMYGCGEF